MSSLCLDIWVHTITNDCTRYAEEAVESLRTEIKKLEEERQSKSPLYFTKSSRYSLLVEKREEHDDLETALREVEKYYNQLKKTTDSPKKLTQVYQELEVVYPRDMEVYAILY